MVPSSGLDTAEEKRSLAFTGNRTTIPLQSSQSCTYYTDYGVQVFFLMLSKIPILHFNFSVRCFATCDIQSSCKTNILIAFILINVTYPAHPA
jgi:hypothetical protein